MSLSDNEKINRKIKQIEYIEDIVLRENNHDEE